ncbi:hypothetical protein C9374_014186 [Naegleria lovaniensis]|uniref:Uncharacterized protein n=1 Tax=Naegleria lovaniensis TaxID=51637 RepID=A0AA88GWB6_NAELO|nr:uncharacterized protein C9374_014186 [Naegleria lovaniensis]KAG2389626.1 hypothetical protein C9374_014186 [Naegleria lovaniensis]
MPPTEQTRTPHSLLFHLPREIFLYNIFEYLIGPIGLFSRAFHALDHTTYQDDLSLSNLLSDPIVSNFSISFENVKGLNSFCMATCKTLVERFLPSQFGSTDDRCDDAEHYNIFMEKYWLTLSNMLDLIIYLKRKPNSLSLVQGDFNAIEAEEMANIQILYQNVEFGKCVKYSETIMDGNSSWYASNYIDHIRSLKDENDVELIALNYEERLRLVVMSFDKYEQVKMQMKGKISSFELFLMKAHILSLGMLEHFDVEQYHSYNQNYMDLVHEDFYDNLTFPHVASRCDYSLDENQAEKSVVASVKEFWPNKDMLPSSAIQFLSVGFDEYFGSCFDDIVFPNVKYLRIVIGHEQYSRTEESIQAEKQLFSALTSKAFPKLCHLSVKGIYNLQTLSQCEILQQLLYLDVIPFPYDEGSSFKLLWNENEMPTLIQLLTRETCPVAPHLIQLIVHGSINCKWSDLTWDRLKEFYQTTRNKFVASLSHSSIQEFYSTCCE